MNCTDFLLCTQFEREKAQRVSYLHVTDPITVQNMTVNQLILPYTLQTTFHSILSMMKLIVDHSVKVSLLSFPFPFFFLNLQH